MFEARLGECATTSSPLMLPPPIAISGVQRRLNEAGARAGHASEDLCPDQAGAGGCIMAGSGESVTYAELDDRSNQGGAAVPVRG
jgi:hypothetical protein